RRRVEADQCRAALPHRRAGPEAEVKFSENLLRQHIAIVAKTGAGKTYTAKGIVEGLLRAGRRVCVADPTRARWGLRSSADGKSPGFPILVCGGTHGDVPISRSSGVALGRFVAGGSTPIILDLSEMLIGARQEFVETFAAEVYAKNRAPLHLVIDEADEF